MRRRKRRVNPVVARQRMMAFQAIGIPLLLIATLFLVYKAMHVA